LVLLATLPLACGGGSSTGSSGTYALGWQGDLTGTAAGNGVPYLAGFQTLIQWTNQHGGVGGHQVRVLAQDDQSNGSTGTIAYQKAVADGVIAIGGAQDSQTFAGPILPRAPQDHISIFGIGMLDPSITPAQPYIYGLNISYAGMASAQVGFVRDYLIKQNLVTANPSVGFFHYTSPAVQSLVDLYRAGIAKEGWKVVSDQSFLLTATDVSSQASQTVAAKPDVLLVNLIDSNAPLAVKSLREKGYKGPIVDFTGASSSATFEALNDAGWYSLRSTYATVNTDQSGIKNIVNQAKATGNTQDITSIYFSLGYVNAAVMLQALKKCGYPCDGPKYNTALENVGKVDVSGLSDNVEMTPTRHRAMTDGIFFRYDTAAKKEVAVGSWFRNSA
jgi:branched-chain amino acid transport system substrate-binding protein